MKCQWQDLLNILPDWIRADVDRQGREDAQEIRMRLHEKPEIVKRNQNVFIDKTVSSDDIIFCINAATRYSPWTAGSVVQGFITAPGGHRIGLCGQCVYDGLKLKNITSISSLCIRVARDIEDVSGPVYQCADSVLIIGAPGCGKTTFLRDLIRRMSDLGNKAVAVIDERREIFPFQDGTFSFDRGKRTDVLSGCEKGAGLNMVLRTMGPAVIALDEITDAEDCVALSNAAWCGVQLIATAHAGNKKELLSRKIYRPILECGVFRTLIVLHADKTWSREVL